MAWLGGPPRHPAVRPPEEELSREAMQSPCSCMAVDNFAGRPCACVSDARGLSSIAPPMRDAFFRLRVSGSRALLIAFPNLDLSSATFSKRTKSIEPRSKRTRGCARFSGPSIVASRRGVSSGGAAASERLAEAIADMAAVTTSAASLSRAPAAAVVCAETPSPSPLDAWK
eukprot:356890-Chlamydomonas_euryale.AAC.8